MLQRDLKQGLIMVASLAWLAGTAAKDLAEYRLGDRISDDIVTPVALLVVDPIATAALHEREALQVPLVYRYDAELGARVEDRLWAQFAAARSNFMVLRKKTYPDFEPGRTALNSQQLKSLLTAFRARERGFPINAELFKEWLAGRSGSGAFLPLVARVHRVMKSPIRNWLPAGAPRESTDTMLIPGGNAGVALQLEDLRRGETVPTSSCFFLAEAQRKLQEMYGPAETEAFRYSLRFIEPNCVFEEELTRLARARHVESLYVADRYRAGQIVAQAGERVDQKVLAALIQIQEKALTSQLQVEVAVQKDQLEQQREQVRSQQDQLEQQRGLVSGSREQLARQREAALTAQGRAQETRRTNRWLIGSVVATAVLAPLGLMALVLRRRAGSIHPPALRSTETGTSSPQELAWQQRALTAEAEAAQAREAIRSGAMEQLRDKAVTSLSFQRAEMLETQRAAAAEIAELERRLNELHAPLQDRLRAYQNRIAELERLLAAKDDQNRELLRAKIELLRRHVELEGSGVTMRYN